MRGCLVFCDNNVDGDHILIIAVMSTVIIELYSLSLQKNELRMNMSYLETVLCTSQMLTFWLSLKINRRWSNAVITKLFGIQE